MKKELFALVKSTDSGDVYRAEFPLLDDGTGEQFLIVSVVTNEDRTAATIKTEVKSLSGKVAPLSSGPCESFCSLENLLYGSARVRHVRVIESI